MEREIFFLGKKLETSKCHSLREVGIKFKGGGRSNGSCKHIFSHLMHAFVGVDEPESRSTRRWGWICWIRSLSDVAETWWDAGGVFACPDTDSFTARCQNREGHSPLAIHNAAFAHILVLLSAVFALCFGESINLT